MKSMKSFFDEEIKGFIKYKLEYTLVNKAIFNREKAQQSSHSFTNKSEQQLKAIHVKIRLD